MKKRWANSGRSLGIAVVLTILVTTLLVVWSPPTAEAVSVNLSGSYSSVAQGGSITFTTTVQIQANERLPIESANLRIFINADLSHELIGSPYSSPRTMDLIATNPVTGGYTTGVGYGYDERASTAHNFPTGYGYGSASEVVTLTYRCIITTTSWAGTTYHARADIDCGTHTFSSAVTQFAVTIPAAAGAGGGGGGGGGGGVPPASTPDATTTPPASTPTAPATPPTPPAPPTPPTIGEPEEVVTEYLAGKIDEEGIVTEEVVVTSHDGGTTVEIPIGTTMLDAQGEPLSEITVQPPATEPPVPPENNMLAVLDFGPDGATFDPPITVTMEYDPADIPEGVAPEDLILAYYDADAGEWIELTNIVVDPVNHTVSGETSHFPEFAILSPVEEVEAPVTPPVDEPTPPVLEPEDDDDGGLNPWVIIGPITGILVIALLAFLEIERRRGSKLF